MTNSEPVERQQLIELADLILAMEEAERAGDSVQANILRNLVLSILRQLEDLGVNLGGFKEILDERRRVREMQAAEVRQRAEAPLQAEEEMLKRQAEEEML